MSIEEQLDEEAFDGFGIVADLVVSRGFGTAQFQPVQRRFAGQRRTVGSLRLQLAGQHGQNRIMPQFIVVVQILVAKGNADDALHHHGLDVVLNQPRCPGVGKAGGKALGQPDRPVGLAQQQGTGIRGDRAAVETGNHLAATQRGKFEQRRATLCRHGAVLGFGKRCGDSTVFRNLRPNASDSVRNAG
jgi:hypothetical protein